MPGQKGPGASACSRIRKADRLHGTEDQGLGAAFSQSLDGHAALEVLFEIPGVHLFRSAKGLVEDIVFVPGHGTVEIVSLVSPFSLFVAVAGSSEDNAIVETVPPDDGRNGVVEIAVLHANGAGKALREALGGKGTGCQDNESERRKMCVFQRGNGFLHKVDAGILHHVPGYARGEELPVYGKRLACRNAAGIGIGHEGTVQIAQFLLEKANAACQCVRAQGIGTDKLAQIVGDVSL